MSTYQTITDRAASPGGSSIMSRTRRRGGKDSTHYGSATMVSCIVNLLNTIVGAGTLAMPSVLSHMGIMLGTLLIVWSGLCSAFGLYLQTRCARYLDRGTSSFFALSQLTYPNASVIFDAAIAIKCFGVGVSYMIIIGDLMPGVVLGVNGHADEIPYLVDRHFWITAFMLLVIPLAFLKRLDSLKYTSLIALVSIGYLIVLVIWHFSIDPHADPSNIRIIKPAGIVETLSALPVVVFAYTCHQNMFSIINEIKDGSPSRLVGVIGSSIGSAATIYLVVAITGYITFGNAIVGNIVSMYPTGMASTIGKAAIVILVLFSIPLQVHPCRASLDSVLKWRPNRGERSAGTRSGSPLLNQSAPHQGDHGSTAPMSDMKFAILTTAILTLAYITALSVSSLDRVLAFVGSTGSTSISFILPGLFYYKISDPDSIHHQRLIKGDDDIEGSDSSDNEDTGALAHSTASLRSATSNASGWRLRRKFRWDLENLDQALLRKMSLSLAVYGMVIMAVCLVMNIFFVTGGH